MTKQEFIDKWIKLTLHSVHISELKADLESVLADQPDPSPIPTNKIVDFIHNEIGLGFLPKSYKERFDWYVDTYFTDKQPNPKPVGGIETTELRFETEEMINNIFLDIPLTVCCGIGPITNENYCPNCGKKITKPI